MPSRNASSATSGTPEIPARKKPGNPDQRLAMGLNWEAMESNIGTRHAAALSLAELAGHVANYCDHAEHNEVLSRDWVTNAASELRLLALTLAASERVDLFAKYGARLRAIEHRNVLTSADSFEGAVAIQQSQSWRDLQLVQIQHDRFYHPDVLGLNKLDQLRHYSLHLAKLAGAFARWAMGEQNEEEIVERRLPDLLLFGLKLATVMGEKLPEEELPREYIENKRRAASKDATLH